MKAKHRIAGLLIAAGMLLAVLGAQAAPADAGINRFGADAAPTPIAEAINRFGGD